MYKIAYQNKSIYLINSKKQIKLNKNSFLIEYDSKETLLMAVEVLKKESIIHHLYITAVNTEVLWNKFESLFAYIEAAGGLVKNKKGELLFIFRKGKWDLPKGKIEKGEKIEDAAIREVEEECGITNLTITKPMINTYHLYEQDNILFLKKTYWFEMICKDEKIPKPQIEEGITAVEWMNENATGKIKENTYEAVIDLLDLH